MPRLLIVSSIFFLGLIATSCARQDLVALAADEASIAQAISSLSDASSEVRAAAAAELRRIVAKYPSGTVNIREPDGGEARWKKVLATIKPGMAAEEVKKILGEGVSPIFEIGSGQSHNVGYRLDYHWAVGIAYRNSPKTVIAVEKLRREAAPSGISLSPPKNYSGPWVTWHANGQKASEYQLSAGRITGLLINYYDNGQKSWEQAHNREHQADGPGRGWYRDGALRYEIHYQSGLAEGRWTHWHPGGKKQLEENWVAGKQDGSHIAWYENGRKKSEQNFKAGALDGPDLAWDDTGKLAYHHEYRNGVVVSR